MELAPLSVACPRCNSTEVLYSCNPACCFNHVCGSCYTTFELATTLVGEFQGEVGPLPPDPDPTAPTAPCARCRESKIFSIEDGGTSKGQLLCVSCKALLDLIVEDIVPGTS